MQNFQVFLGFIAIENELQTYDKGIYITTKKGVRDILNSYCYRKQQDFSSDLSLL